MAVMSSYKSRKVLHTSSLKLSPLIDAVNGSAQHAAPGEQTPSVRYKTSGAVLMAAIAR